MARVELIGVPFDGFGRTGHQARAAQALRDAGLEGAFGEHEVLAGPDLVLPPPDPRRAPGSGLMNEAALLAMVQAVHGRVSEALAVHRFPVIYGGECSALLGAVSGLGATGGQPGLVFVDAHEDTTPLDVSVDGEAANMELGLLLGITGQLAPAALRSVLPALDPAALAVLGPRDQELRRKCNVASLADRNIHLRRHDAVAVDPAEVARKAVEHVRKTAPSWWLHTDLDVIAQDTFTAGRVPGDEYEDGGLNWAQLTELTATAFACGGCAGWSIVIYDPEQDENGSQARRIVEFVSAVSSALPRRP
ncbi:MAG TPA: arginase family protein [Solirubrobacterales bacterium]|nr:arginase family protein [Solirubrobacterales bacterium]